MSETVFFQMMFAPVYMAIANFSIEIVWKNRTIVTI